MPSEIRAVVGRPVEWVYSSGQAHGDPFNELEVDALVTDPEGREWKVPAYWAGGGEWRVRFAPRLAGAHRVRSACSDASDPGLHGREALLRAEAGEEPHPLLRHGPLRASADRRHLEHRDGRPFFWLADTWWMALCRRLAWPDEFQMLVADRKAKGFTVVQIVAGLYPDMPAFDPRGANEAGFPWEPDFARINPAYFDMADLRIAWMVREGLVPCIVGCWGYYLGLMGVEKVRRHWRCLVARYGAWPVVWCLAGEATMPYYLSADREGDARRQKQGWTELARYLHKIDSAGHPVTVHPTVHGRDQVEDPALLDLEMLQTGHSGHASIAPTLAAVTAAVGREPRMPVVNAEVCYEGILEGSREEIQRFMFWSCMLSGAAGHTYGANGLWQLNRREQPYGPSPHGASWGDTPWEDACRLPGAAQVALGKRILEGFEWWRFQSRPDWVEPRAGPDHWLQPHAAGIPGEVRVLYFPQPIFPWGRSFPSVCGLEPGQAYRARFVSPKDGAERLLGEARGDAQGRWPVPPPPVMHDWLLILERA